MAETNQSRFITAPPAVAGIEDLEVIGRGGFGTVYRGHQAEFHRTVAVKVLDCAPDDVDAGRRFRHEIAAMGSVSHHPHVVAVYAAGSTGDRRPFLVMPYLPGGTLAERIEQRPMPWRDVVGLGVRLAGALEAAHSAGVLHRDVKPANILFSSYGEPQLADFGIARIVDSTRTATGLVTATLSYAPPEILSGDVAVAASDIYSLAATLHAALMGRPPFAGLPGEPLATTVARIVTDPTPDLRPSGVPEVVAAVIERAMVKDPERRTSTAQRFGAELAAVATAADPIVRPVPGPPPLPAAAPLAPTAPTARAGAPPSAPTLVETDEDRRRPGAALLWALLAIVVVGAAFAASRILFADENGAQAGPSRTTNLPSATSTPTSTSSSTPDNAAATSAPPSTEPAPTSTAASSTTTVPETTAPSTTTPPATTPASTAPSIPPSGSAPGAATVEATVAGYYGNVAGRPRAEMFAWLTPGYQDVTGFGSYNAFWGSIRSVTASDVAATGPNTASATLTYVTNGGGRSVERVRLGLVRDDATGNYLIDSYRVG